MTLIPTVRLCILEATKDFLATMKDTLPEDDPYGFTPSLLSLGKVICLFFRNVEPVLFLCMR